MKHAHKGVIVSIIPGAPEHTDVAPILSRVYNWKFRGATISLCCGICQFLTTLRKMLVNSIILIKDTSPYLELRPGSPTVSIQKPPVIVGACHCFHEMILCRALKFVHEDNKYIGTLHIYIRITWAGQCRGW